MADVKKLNLAQKLVEVQKTARGLGKDAKAQTYDYVSGSKVLGVIRPKMDELGLLLIPEVVSIENERMDYSVRSGAKSEMHSKVMMKFTWIDSESGEKLECSWGANGQNGWDKGLGSALTYGERYFLLKFFHIATDEDDIDARHDEEAAPTPVKPMLMKGSGAWEKAVVRLASGEQIRQKLADSFAMDEATWAELERDVVDFKISNNLK